MSILEIIAIIFTLVCVYLTSKQNIWCWPTGIVSILAFLVIYIDEKLIVLTYLQIVFLSQSIFAWYNWYKGKNGKELIVLRKDTILILKDLLAVIFCSSLLGFYLEQTMETSLPYLDALSSMLCILGTLYLTKKYLESWLIWMVVNTLLFGIFLYQELYLLSGLEVLLFIISLKAYISWKKDLKQH